MTTPLVSTSRKYRSASSLWNRKHKASENRGKERGGMIRGFVPVDFETLSKLVDSMNVADWIVSS